MHDDLHEVACAGVSGSPPSCTTQEQQASTYSILLRRESDDLNTDYSTRDCIADSIKHATEFLKHTVYWGIFPSPALPNPTIPSSLQKEKPAPNALLRTCPIGNDKRPSFQERLQRRSQSLPSVSKHPPNAHLISCCPNPSTVSFFKQPQQQRLYLPAVPQSPRPPPSPPNRPKVPSSP